VDLLTYFILTLVFSTLFAMGGVGSAIALVSVFPMAGMASEMARAVGLFINTTSTISASIMNMRRGEINLRFALPLVISILLSTPLGAFLSADVPENALKWILIVFLLLSAILLLRPSRVQKFTFVRLWVLYIIGGSVGLISGMLGVGGGSLIIPLLILLGFEPKQAAYTVSFVIPFSSLGGFLTYLHFVDMNWSLLAVVTIAAFFGGIIGNKMMHDMLSQQQVKILVACVLILLALKLIFMQLILL